MDNNRGDARMAGERMNRYNDTTSNGMSYDNVGPGSDNTADDRADLNRSMMRSDNSSYRSDSGYTGDRDYTSNRNDTSNRDYTSNGGNSAARTNTEVGPGSGNTADQARIASERAGGMMTAQDFVQHAASGGMFEVQSSKLALSNSQDQNTRQFAQRMIDDHSRINDKLKSIASEENIQVPSQMLPPDQSEYDKLQNLSGSDFDREYHTAQAKGHHDTIDLFDAHRII